MNKELIEIDKLFKSNNYDEVISKTKKLIKKGQIIAPYYNLLGLSLDKIGKTYQAEKTFLDAINKNSKEISFYSNLANILIKQNKLNEAEKYLIKGLEIKADDTFSLYEYGRLKRFQKVYLEALNYFEKTYKINPNFPNALFMIGKTYIDLYQETNDNKYIELAKKTLLQCSNLFPENVDADYILSEVYDYKTEKHHQKVMLKKIDNINFVNKVQKSVLYFALAKSFEDQKKFDQSSEFLKIANSELDSTFKKDLIINYSKKFDNLKFLFDKIINIKNFNEEGIFKEKIIFILGMPRSGTTLVHQLLASTKDTEGLGESDIMPSFFDKQIFSKEFFDKIYKNQKLNKSYLCEISKLLGDKYKNAQSTNKNIIIDKNPSNFFWIGFIKLLFPNAKVVHTKRNLKDTCLSVYKNMFGSDELNWSYSPSKIINYVKIYLKIINYWNKKYNNFIYQIDYEKLIKDKNEETKKLFSYCEINWSEEIFDFYKTGKPIRTASLYQVKKPIYKSSLDNNKNFSDYLHFLNDLDNLK